MGVSTKLYDRDVTLTLGTTRIATRDPVTKDAVPALRVAFKVVRTTAKQPDSAEVTVYNLSPENRVRLQEKSLPVVLEAGYVGSTHEIFSGQLAYSQSVLNGTDWVTTFKAADGVDAFKGSRINVGMRGPVTMRQALETAAAAMGLPLGNVSQEAGNSPRPSLSQFVNGLVLSGKAELQLDKITKAFGARWFVQGGAIQVLTPTGVLAPGERALLKPGTGLVGSPEAGEQGIVKVRALIQPGLFPGHGVRVESVSTTGNFRVEKATATGDTHGQDWYYDLELKPQ